MRFWDKGRLLTELKAAGKALLLVLLFIGVAFLGGMVGGLAISGHFGDDAPERTGFRRNWDATVSVVLSDGRRGSGVIVSRQGHVLTVAHVVTAAEGGRLRVEVDGTILEKTYDAEVVAVDEDGDLALLRIPLNYRSPAFIEMRDVPPFPGDDIYGIGFPGDLGEGKTVNTGCVRILRMNPREAGAPLAAFDTMITSGRFEPGHSGGGIFLDRNGLLVGLVTMEMWAGTNLFQMRSNPVIIPARRIRPFLATHGVRINDPGPSWFERQWRQLTMAVSVLLG